MTKTEFVWIGAYSLPPEDDFVPRPVPGKLPSCWMNTRRRVFERDRGRCHACGLFIEADNYECGHIIDRCAGGSDDDFNLVVMCVMCNRLKGVHRSREEYFAWLDWWGGVARRAIEALFPELKA